MAESFGAACGRPGPGGVANGTEQHGR